MSSGKKYEQALPIGFRLIGGSHNYVIEQVLGQGGFGITYKVKARIMAGNIAVTTHFAVKEFFPSGCWRNSGSTDMLYAPTTEEEVKACLKDFVAEGQRLQRVCNMNTNIVKVNEVFEANGTAYFVMEYLSGGDLRKLVENNGGGISEAAMLSIITPVARAIECLHQNDMLHLDIKPENIVMRLGDDGAPDVPVLIDFGIAVHFTRDGAPTTTRPSKGVTQGYSPVEQFAGINRFDPRIDIYALAATCYFLLTGKDPKSAFEINANTIAGDLAGKASDRTINNIIQAMSKEASMRPGSISQFLNGFRESVALKPNTVIKGMYQPYLITAVIDEKNDYVLYRASLANANTSQNEFATRRIGGGASNVSLPFMLWEQLNNGERVKPEDVPSITPWIVPVERGYANRAFGGQVDDQNAIVSEYFVDGGVEFIAVRQDYVQQQQVPAPMPQPEYVPQVDRSVGAQQERKRSVEYYEPSSKGNSKKTLIIILSVLGVILVMALAAWAVIAMSGGNEDESMRLDDAISYEDKQTLKEFAEKDSVRAFLPLAYAYEVSEDYDKALKWANAALDSGELSYDEENDAEELVSRLMDKQYSSDYYPSTDDDEIYYEDEADSVM